MLRRYFLRTGLLLGMAGLLPKVDATESRLLDSPTATQNGNPRELPKPFRQDIHLIDVHIAGTTYVEGIEKLEPSLTEGTKLQLFRENNAHDPSAIVIKNDDGNKFGYIPRRHNGILARLMDDGKLLHGVIQSKEFVNDWLKITVRVYLCDCP